VDGNLGGPMKETTIFGLSLFLFAALRITEISVEINGSTGHDVEVQTGWAEFTSGDIYRFYLLV
jgi:hypothetical protein